MHGAPVHTLVRGRFVMRDSKLITEAAGSGRSIKSVQKMPTSRPLNTDRYTNAILTTPPGVPPTALTMSLKDI